jgi:hypothetical protein
MNKGLNIFLAVLLCVVVYIGLLLSFYSSKNVEASTPYLGDVKSTRGTYGTYAVSANSMGSNMATISVRSANSIFHHRSVFSYVPAASMPTYSQSPIGGTLSKSVASPIYTTSSAEFHSFGGGGNTGGVSMSGGVVSSNSQSPIANTQLAVQGGGLNGITTSSPNSFNTSSFNNLINISPNSLIASLPASDYQGIASMGDLRGIRGRQSAGPATNTGGWLNWLVLNGYGTQGADGIWGLDIYQLRQAYDDYVRNWNSTMGKKPTWDEWLAWFMGSEGNPYMWDDGENQYGFSFVPVGDFMPLIVFALLYVVLVMYRRRQCKMINSNEDVE